MTTRSQARAATRQTRSAAHEKENKKTAVPKQKPPPRASARDRKGKAKAKTAEVYCLCKGVDDGTPMVQCAVCKDWFHFRCINLTEEEAEEIMMYVCSPCTEKTGRRTVMDWEGPDSLEPVENPQEPPAPPPVKAEESEESEPEKPEPAELSESSDGGTEDEYVEETEKRSVSKRASRQVRDSDSESDEKKASSSKPRRPSVNAAKAKSATRSSSPPSSHLKRKSSIQAPRAKRTRSGSTAADDPTRKYCLSKLREMLVKIFTTYGLQSDEDKAALGAQANTYAETLEQCLYDAYAEADKGKQSAGPKYKERFRMISFNLPQADRVQLHRRIASGELAPATLAGMSSTDLASEETRASIKHAEEEALAHSILQKATVPRAKITHKGLENIEDVNEDLARQRAREIAREEEEEERRRERERERLARLRTRAPSASVPPESPITPSAPSAWGAPPPIPMHAMQAAASPTDTAPYSASRPLFMSAPSDMQPMETELNLGDLIHIDEEPAPDAAQPPVALEIDLEAPKFASPAPEPAPVTGISPFAANKPDMAPRASFDLSSLWSGPAAAKREEGMDIERPPTPPPPDPAEHVQPMATDDGDHEMHIEAHVETEADDHDFDMFLEPQEEQEPEAPQPTPEEAFGALPRVWTGILSMPLDSTIPQETHVFARQIGGRALEHDSPLWRTLFPMEQLRIDGRVPVRNSAQYLLQSRMNAAKELIAVAFDPSSEEDAHKFRQLADFLINKDRHGLIFPWGNRGREWGKELYVIPLLSAHPLPDYIEILDGLQLPRERKADHLIGIWVLARGKLAPPPSHPQPHHPTPTASTTQPTPSIPELFRALNLPQLSSHTPTPPIPGLGMSPLPPSSIPPPSTAPPAVQQPFAPPPGVSPALAAEVASLTPEQVQAMLQTLRSAVGLGALTAPPPPQPPQPVLPPYPPAPSFAPSQAGAPTPWVNSLLASLQPGVAPPTLLPIPQPQPPPPPPPPPYDRYDERGRGGRGRGRARGGRGRNREERRASEGSAWPRRGRTRGGPPPVSPDRGYAGRREKGPWS